MPRKRSRQDACLAVGDGDREFSTEKELRALAGWLGWLEHHPLHQKVVGSIPIMVHTEATTTDGCFSLSASPPFPLSQKSINISLRKDLKKKEREELGAHYPLLLLPPPGAPRWRRLRGTNEGSQSSQHAPWRCLFKCPLRVDHRMLCCRGKGVNTTKEGEHVHGVEMKRMRRVMTQVSATARVML